MKIDKFDKVICRHLGEAVLQALQKLEAEYGVKFTRRGGTYSDTNYSIKLEASVVANDGTVLSRESDEFKRYCSIYNLDAEDLGKTFTDISGTQYKILGLNSRSSKYPIVAQRVADGKNFKLGEAMVQRGLGKKVKEVVL